MPGPGSIIDRIVDVVAQRGLAFGQELVGWMASVQAHAIQKWTPVALAQISCCRSTPRGPCTRQALAACVVCREAVCLEHAVIAANADVACSRCMDYLVKKALEQNDVPVPEVAPPPPGPEPARVHPLEERRLRAFHLGILCVPEGASDDTLRRAHRKLSAKWHPDKYQTSKDKEIALEQYKRVQVALDWLTRFGTSARAA